MAMSNENELAPVPVPIGPTIAKDRQLSPCEVLDMTINELSEVPISQLLGMCLQAGRFQSYDGSSDEILCVN